MRGDLSSWARLGVLAFAGFACAQIVGITDTNVTRQDGQVAAEMDGSQAGSAGAGSVRSPGAAGTGMAGAPMAAAGNGGSSVQPGVAGAGGGVPMPMLGSAGSSPLMPGCGEQAARCGAAGREVCIGGVWEAQACPPQTPTCEAEGQCVVRGPALVSVSGLFFVDSTEVTVAQYRQFLTAKNGDVSGQIPACSWNLSYYEGPLAMPPDAEPIVNVDWCDAEAFCAWADKHLCGRIGGGQIARADVFDPNLNQWYLACGGPNGGTAPNDNPTCNASQGFQSVAPVASFPGCEGYYPGVFDMSGNVTEWIDSCDGENGADDICYLMGGSTLNTRTYCTQIDEDEADPWLRSTTTPYAGIRCCAG